MKKIFLLLFFIAYVQSVFAQSIQFGVKGGLNEATVQIPGLTNNTAITTISKLSGFNAGLFSDVQFSTLSIETGISYTTTGYHTKTVPTPNFNGPFVPIADYTLTRKTAINYLEVPINLLYNITTGPCKIFVGGGPYGGLAISGTTQSIFTSNGSTTIDPPNKLTFGRSIDFFKRTDFGVNALAGITLKDGFLFNVDYGYGLNNISNSYGNTVKNRVFSLSLGYVFFKHGT